MVGSYFAPLAAGNRLYRAETRGRLVQHTTRSPTGFRRGLFVDRYTTSHDKKPRGGSPGTPGVKTTPRPTRARPRAAARVTDRSVRGRWWEGFRGRAGLSAGRLPA